MDTQDLIKRFVQDLNRLPDGGIVEASLSMDIKRKSLTADGDAERYEYSATGPRKDVVRAITQQVEEDRLSKARSGGVEQNPKKPEVLAISYHLDWQQAVKSVVR
jgi:hypothetical protein